MGLRFVAPVSAKARNMLSRRKSKISIPISNSTKMVVNETRISEAKVTIRELFEGITNWMAGFPKSWSTPPGSAKRLLGWRLLFHAMFPTFTNLNAKTWTQRMRGRRPYDDDWNGKEFPWPIYISLCPSIGADHTRACSERIKSSPVLVTPLRIGSSEVAYDWAISLAMYVRLGRRISDVAVNYCPIQR